MRGSGSHRERVTPGQPGGGAALRVCLLGGFAATVGDEPLELPTAAKRLIAYLALQRRRVVRSRVAGVLWPETTQERAQGSLRSTLWRVRKVSDQLVDGDLEALGLARAVAVDVDVIVEAAEAIDSRASVTKRHAVAASWLSNELLPGWVDDWVMFERERFRLMALRVLEGLARHYTEAADYGRATDSALAAIRLEPLRESGHRALVRAHLAQGNAFEAVRHYRHYRDLVHAELGVEPSRHMVELLSTAGLAPGADVA